MKAYLVKTPWFVQKYFSKYTWKKTTNKKEVYLTFDDGPIPKITPWVLQTLKDFNAKATFFSIGDNIRKYPDIFKQVIQENHSIGNHTFHHLRGTETSFNQYLKNTAEAERIIQKHLKPKEYTPNLFRPPYGKIKVNQAKSLIKKGYQIIMWDVLSADFDQTISPEKCLNNVINNVKNGSIIVFHDSEKAFKNLKYTLPKTLEILTKKGYTFKTL